MHLSYESMVSFIALYGSQAALAVDGDLDAQNECLLDSVSRVKQASPVCPNIAATLDGRQVWFTLKETGKTQVFNAKPPWPYAIHYFLNIIDKEWGHLTIKMSGHPSFGIQVLLNGHEWVER